MRSSRSYIILVAFQLITFNAIGQISAELVQELRRIVLPQSAYVPATSFVDCADQVINADLQIRSPQPNVKEALALQSQLILRADLTDFKDDLDDIYSRALTHYESEWGDLYLRNFYSCNTANQQFRILRGFEELNTVIYLHQNNLTPTDLFDWIETRSNYEYLLITDLENRDSLLTNYNYYSKRLKKLAIKAVFANGVNFSYIDPFAQLLANQFFSKLRDFDIANFELGGTMSSEAKDYYFIKDHINVYSRIKNSDVKLLLISDFDIWLSKGLQVVPIIILASYDDPDVVEFILEQLLHNSKFERLGTDPRVYYFKHLLAHEKSRQVAHEYLKLHAAESAEVSGALSLEFATYFTDLMTKEFLTNYLKWLDSNQIILQRNQVNEIRQFAEGFKLRVDLSSNHSRAIDKMVNKIYKSSIYNN